MLTEQKISHLQKVFPSSEVKQLNSHIRVRHDLDKMSGSEPKQPKFDDFCKNILQTGDGFDYVFATSRQNLRRRTDPSDELETVHYTSLVTNDGTVHQMKTVFFPSFTADFRDISQDIVGPEKPIQVVDGFVEATDDGRLNYFIIPPEDGAEKKQSAIIWDELFKKIFWFREEKIQENIDISLSLADPFDVNNQQVVLTASYRNNSLSVVLDENSAVELQESMRKPYRGAIRLLDIREKQKVSKSANRALPDF